MAPEGSLEPRVSCFLEDTGEGWCKSMDLKKLHNWDEQELEEVQK